MAEGLSTAPAPIGPEPPLPNPGLPEASGIGPIIGPTLTTDPALGGPLWVSPAASGSGQVFVATDALLAHTERLTRLHNALLANGAGLDRIDSLGVGYLALTHPGPAAAAARRSSVQLDAARVAVRSAAALADRADTELRQAAAAYTAAEDEQSQRALQLGQLIAMQLGPALRVLLIAALPAVLFSRATGIGPSDETLGGLKDWMLKHPEVITNPGFVEGVRTTVMSVDDATGSMLGLPPFAAEEIAAAFGFVGVEAGAAITLGAGRPFGMFRETPVSVDRVATTSGVSAPSGAQERLARVPEVDQVRIERYDAPGQPPRYVVYVGPTETFSPVATDEPWDLTSNVAGVAGLEAGSLRATELAMQDAGIGSGDEVQFVGFSQGGLIATMLAASGDWNAAGLETYGAPAGNIDLPSGLDGMAIRNSDDFIPALAGPQLDHNLLQVERRAFAPGSPIPTAEPAPAHQREAYVATASVIDDAESQAVREQVAALDAFTGDYARQDGSATTVMTYHAERGAVRAMAPAPAK